ncbi:SixA phosphatase family protein [Rubrobacter xylanophilus]|uniref:SixA phosphatase family protein n=1 Tax=Rubrobacter xylanophilus TaxID=49319 RepID=UPI001A7E408B|nr:histidine phosphatase family protein [Rubrobacter xylanophilus]
MDLYLVRHAVAHVRDPERWPDDGRRPLTPRGERKFRAAARGLSRLLPAAEVVLLSSPYERAWRTARILAEEGAWPGPISLGALLPGARVEETAAALAEHVGTVVAVGHRPSLHRLAAYLLTREAEGAEIRIKKGGAAYLGFEGPLEPGAGELRWLLTPKMLRSLA